MRLSPVAAHHRISNQKYLTDNQVIALKMAFLMRFYNGSA